MPLVKGHETTSRRDDDVPYMTADALSCDYGSFVECGPTITPHSPAVKRVKAILQDPFDSKGCTHTHTFEIQVSTCECATDQARK